ncbi:hypothetical protein K490DRAFT_32875 [Saccharata proteae CBS 121410]|uniref:DUF6697 domain-containing protein n=1 Tax=Saccharata proteae CBS 121410 TaxID=1314787 RepID=A0A9P4I362_9PEZI|nr:hypothetical protein K490DRAFT_32875 [Saccharata proteae CBS 121410]
MPSVEDPGLKFVKANSSWQPLAIRRLPPLPAAELSVIPGKTTMKTFSWGFLQEFYGGKQWSPSFYYVPPSHGKVLLPSRSWYGIDAKYEPYMPHSPGAHGAKLTAFFNPDSPEDVHGDENGNSLHNVPLFISASNWATDLPEKQYVYFGMYSQLRFSDKLDYERMVESVPHEVKMYWAEQLSSPARPEWVTDQLKKHFFPKPEYQGHLPGPDVDSCVVRSDFAEYRRELQEWESDASMVAGSLSKEEILQAFEQEDANEPRGLRLWWEYLQCIGWDSGFYHMLLKAQGRYCKSVHL